MIDSEGRIVFDSSDDAGDASLEAQDTVDDFQEDEEDSANATTLTHDASVIDKDNKPEQDEPQVEIDLASIKYRFFPDLSNLDDLDVCHTLKDFDLGNPDGSMDIAFLKAPEDWRLEQEKERALADLGDISGLLIEGDAPAGFDDDDLGLGAFDLGGDVAFGEGGEAWAREAALEPQMRVVARGYGEDVDGENFDDNNDFVVSMNQSRNPDQMHDDILGFFDQALQKNWTSAEHWRIRKIKDAGKPAGETKKRKEKEPFEIDFSSSLDAAQTDLLYSQATTNAAISMSKKDWKSKSRNLLPDDKHFNSKSLLSLFLKPKARLSRRRTGFGTGKGVFGNVPQDDAGDVPMDEAFWSQQNAPQQGSDDTVLPQGDYDANFFQDDHLPFANGDDLDDDDMEFADAREHFSPGLDGADGGMTEGVGMAAMLNADTVNPYGGAFGSTLVTATRRVRPDYVQYARVAKKVDVRRLKEEIWKGMGLEQLQVSGQRLSQYYFTITTLRSIRNPQDALVS